MEKVDAVKMISVRLADGSSPKTKEEEEKEVELITLTHTRQCGKK